MTMHTLTMTKPASTTAGTLDLTGVAARFDRDGAASVATDLDVLAHRARAVGVKTAGLGVMADPSAPEVVRARAFSHVVGAYGRALARLSTDSFVAVA